VLWIRLDPEMILLRDLIIEQPDFQWQYQLRHERDVTAQFQANQSRTSWFSSSTHWVFPNLRTNGVSIGLKLRS